MVSSTLALTCSIPTTPRQCLLIQHSPSVSQWQLVGSSRLSLHTTRRHAFRLLANPNVTSSSKKEVIMVDPLEAKRLAGVQMEDIKAKEKFKKRRQIEAINGAWAMIGLTAGLVIEAQTGKSIVSQLTGYWDDILGFFMTFDF